MVVRLVSFCGGGVFGGVGAILAFWFNEHSPAHWGIVGLAAFVMGCLAALFGRRFWEIALTHWPQ